MQLTSGQKEVIDILYHNPRYRMETNELVTRLNADRVHPEWGYDRLHGVLRRLEGRGIAYKTDRPYRWQLTGDARNAYKKQGALS